MEIYLDLVSKLQTLYKLLDKEDNIYKREKYEGMVEALSYVLNKYDDLVLEVVIKECEL